jgi:hypothetical protein
MTQYFTPAGAEQAAEDTYQRLRVKTEREMGRAPSQRRIMEIWSRRGRLDCITRVGDPDPIDGAIVTAIFDMGPHQPFVVYRDDPSNPESQACEVLANNAYEVSEFPR